MMELILTTPIEDLTPKLISFNNEEIISQLKPQLEHYKTTIYAENEISIAKSDRANLNKLKDAIEDERKRIKKYYNQPYDKFEQQVKEITSLIDETTKTIDSQVKTYEDQKKQAKKHEIIEFWNNSIGDLKTLINIETVFSEQWLNTTYSMKKVQEDIINFISKVSNDLSVISSLHFKQETYLKDFYLRTFDLAATLQEKTRLEENEKRIVELEQKQNKDKVEEKQNLEILVVDFRVYATRPQIEELRRFLDDKKIKYGKVPTKNI